MQGLVRKRLVPFLLAPDAATSFTGNTSTFEPLFPALRSKLSAFAYTPERPLSPAERVLGVGSRVYADRTSSKSIGEVVHLDSTGTIGIAMLQQAALLGTTGNFVVRAPVPKAEGAQEQIDTEDRDHHAAEGSVSMDGAIGYISTYRPDWFKGLDPKTGNVLDA